MRLFLLLILTSGCGHSVVIDPAGPPRATLEVINRTNTPALVDVSGEFLGTVASGTRSRFRMLNPGMTQLVARTGDSTTSQWKTQKQLLGGQVVNWELKPVKGAPLELPPKLTKLELKNTSNNALDFSLDGTVPRTLMPRDTRTVFDLPVGPHKLVVTVPLRRYHRVVSVELKAGQKNILNIGVETAKLVVTNKTSEGISLLVNGITVAQVPNGQKHTISDLVVGLHQLRVRGNKSSREYSRKVRLVKDEVYSWDLTAAEGEVTLKNRTGETIHYHLGERQKGILADKASVSLKNVPLGALTAKGTGTESNYVWSAELSVTPSQVVTWTLRNNVGSLRVTNKLQQPVQIRTQGKFKRRLVPNSTQFIDELPTGNLRVEIFPEVSKKARLQIVEISPRQSSLLTVQDPMARRGEMNSNTL